MEMEKVRVESVTSAQLADQLNCSELFIRSKLAKPTSRNTTLVKLKTTLVCSAMPQVKGEHHKNLKRIIERTASWEGVTTLLLVDDHDITHIGEENAPISVAELLALYVTNLPSPRKRIPITRDALKELL